MEVTDVFIKGLKIIKPAIFEDGRGAFFESYNSEKFNKLGIEEKFVQDNQSQSHKGILRGLHFQTGEYAQAKLVRVIKGSVLDVAVDLRKNSATFGKHFSLELNDKNNLMFYIPVGFAHGFIALEDQTIFVYKCSALYNKQSEGGIIWNDSSLGIDWGHLKPIVSEKDAILPAFNSVGVVAVISPFNYPLYIASTKMIPALLAGNSVVVKPSSSNPISALLLVRVLEASGVPEGSLNVVTGKGDETGDALIKHERVGMINFTGSTPVGKRISQMAGMKKLHLELGGKGYALVLEDADLDLAAKKCVFGSFKFSGQRCDAISAVLAVETIADDLCDKILREVDRWKFGDPRDESVMAGPVINPAAAERIHRMVTDAVEKGARLLRGGKFRDSYYEPTVLDEVPVSSVIAHEETFGPVVTILRPKNEDEALKIARESKYGLESCVFTRDFYRMWRVAKRLECGEVTVNDYPAHGVGYFPFGGIKDSGMGREGIGYSIDEMTNIKTIVFNLEAGGLGKKEQASAMCKTGGLRKARTEPENGV